MESATPTQSGDLASQYALRVALQTMKERCITLQRRLIAAEEENQQMRERIDNEQKTPKGGLMRATSDSGTAGGAAETFQLRLHVAELLRQKTLLNEHINMVSNENRKLWSRLSQMTKEQGKPINAPSLWEGALPNDEEDDGAVLSPRSTGGGGANQNLIRSKTFTQHSPNPHLRHKLISNERSGGTDALEHSMEEVTLNNFGNNVEIAAGVEYATVASETELGFAYLNVVENSATHDDEADDVEFQVEAKNCLEGMKELHREALKQRSELTAALAMLESRLALQPCTECMQKSQKPEMADKSLETDESLNEVKFYNNSQLVNDTLTPRKFIEPAAETTPQHINILQEKIKADGMDKMCPMCGKIYNIPFEAFQRHVEMHFEDTSDIEASLEHNYEFISHTVGDF